MHTPARTSWRARRTRRSSTRIELHQLRIQYRFRGTRESCEYSDDSCIGRGKRTSRPPPERRPESCERLEKYREQSQVNSLCSLIDVTSKYSKVPRFTRTMEYHVRIQINKMDVNSRSTVPVLYSSYKDFVPYKTNTIQEYSTVFYTSKRSVGCRAA